MAQQNNFEKGVNHKSTTSTATCGEAEKGESTKTQMEFKCDVEPPKSRKPRPGAQVNFPNGS